MNFKQLISLDSVVSYKPNTPTQHSVFPKALQTRKLRVQILKTEAAPIYN